MGSLAQPGWVRQQSLVDPSSRMRGTDSGLQQPGCSDGHLELGSQEGWALLMAQETSCWHKQRLQKSDQVGGQKPG